MQIKTLSYKRINNLGNYSSEHLEAFAEVEDGEDPIVEAQKLKAIVEESLGLNKPKEPPAKPKEQALVYREAQPNQPSNGDEDEEFKF